MIVRNNFHSISSHHKQVLCPDVEIWALSGIVDISKYLPSSSSVGVNAISCGGNFSVRTGRQQTGCALMSDDEKNKTFN